MSDGKRLSPAVRDDREGIVRLLRRTGVFSPAEVAVGREVLDVYLDRPEQEDYLVQCGFLGPRLAGYICFGPNTMTDGLWEYYWVAVDPDCVRRGVGRDLVTFADGTARRGGGRMAAVETSSREVYEPARRFYRGCGFTQTAVVPDFYADGDDKVIFTKRLSAP